MFVINQVVRINDKPSYGVLGLSKLINCIGYIKEISTIHSEVLLEMVDINNSWLYPYKDNNERRFIWVPMNNIKEFH